MENLEAFSSLLGSPPRGNKRPRQFSDAGQYSTKRQATSSAEITEYLIIHEVICSQERSGHYNHREKSAFRDAPRLYMNDCKASALRGQTRVSERTDDLADNPEILFVVYKRYDCEQYHSTIEDLFHRLRLPNVEPDDVEMLRPYFTLLPNDSPTAEPISASLKIISKDLIHSLNILETRRTGRPATDLFEQMIPAPYIILYHLRELSGTMSDCSAPAELAAVRTLYDYLDDDSGSDYAEAENLFKSGRVSRKHFDKLFRSNELVLMHEDGQPVVVMADRCEYAFIGDGSLELTCKRLLFDGQFYQKDFRLLVPWPLNADLIGISSLIAYPLRLDTNGARVRLLRRGMTFWSCRNRRFVSYTAPKRTFEIQVV
jgi:hypothetical protein